jgi:TetR/AcrR family transcriptional regulator, transcriptional repressor for nem operon
MSVKRTWVVDTAELMIRAGGYQNLDRQDIAVELGVEVPEIEAIFPSKDDLALAVAIRYTYNFLIALGETTPDGSTPETQITRYCKVFIKAFEDSGLACLCGVLSKEVDSMPEKVETAVKDFVNANIDWLMQALNGKDRKVEDQKLKESAQWIYCSLQGAMTASVLTKDKSWLYSATNGVLNQFFGTNAKAV